MGQPDPVDNDFIFMPANTGWHVDRASFDRMLANAAARARRNCYNELRLRELQWAGEQWRLKLSTALRSPRASSSTPPVARQHLRGAWALGSRTLDRLVGIARFFETDVNDSRLLVEAFEHGWWYTAGLPGESDRELRHGCRSGPRLQLDKPEEWQRRLAAAAWSMLFAGM